MVTIIFLLCCKSKQEYSFLQNHTNVSNYDNSSNAEINLLRNGDIIMRQGRGAISLSLNEKYKLSHCGILSIDDTTKF